MRRVIRAFAQRDYRVVSLDRQFFLPNAFHRRPDVPAISARIERVCGKLGLVGLVGSFVTLRARKSGQPHSEGGLAARNKLRVRRIAIAHREL